MTRDEAMKKLADLTAAERSYVLAWVIYQNPMQLMKALESLKIHAAAAALTTEAETDDGDVRARP